jgi:hypothetical protein
MILKSAYVSRGVSATVWWKVTERFQVLTDWAGALLLLFLCLPVPRNHGVLKAGPADLALQLRLQPI